MIFTISLIFGIIVLLFIVDLFSSKSQIKAQLRKNFNPNYVNTKHQHNFIQMEANGINICNFCNKIIGSYWGYIFSNQMYECRICGIISHKICSKLKNKQIKCKKISSNNQFTCHLKMKHQWIDGNLPIYQTCSHCGELCIDMNDQTYAGTCLWCQRVTHNHCREQLKEYCDFGPLSKVILKPYQICVNKLNKPFNLNESKISDVKIININKENSIVVVVVNEISGGQSGKKFLKSFYRYLNPIQIVSIQEDGLQKLQIFKCINNLKIVVAGGDGTVASVINYMRKEIPEWKINSPPVAILPLGTGNDLSRALSWGNTYGSTDGKKYLTEILEQTIKVNLDRWKVSWELENDNQTHFLYNYFGIGADAYLVKDFHDIRDKYPYLFKSRLGNKVIYGQIGASNSLFGRKFQIHKQVQLYCDDQLVDLCEMESLIIMNINYWGGGKYNLWGNNKSSNILNDFVHNIDEQSICESELKNQRINDGLIEVAAFKSILQMAQSQVELAVPQRICQGKKIEIKLLNNNEQIIQIDGEPFTIVGPGKIQIVLEDKIPMLVRKNSWTEQDLLLQSKILEVLHNSEESHLITNEQRIALIDKFSQSFSRILH